MGRVTGDLFSLLFFLSFFSHCVVLPVPVAIVVGDVISTRFTYICGLFWHLNQLF